MSYLTSESIALEESYEDNMRLLYRIHARRAKLLGLWAAEKMFIFGDKAVDYAVNVVLSDHALAGGAGMHQKIEKDFQENDIEFDIAEFKEVFNNLLLKAQDEVRQEQDIYELS